jgi:hypothetical protein
MISPWKESFQEALKVFETDVKLNASDIAGFVSCNHLHELVRFFNKSIFGQLKDYALDLSHVSRCPIQQDGRAQTLNVMDSQKYMLCLSRTGGSGVAHGCIDEVVMPRGSDSCATTPSGANVAVGEGFSGTDRDGSEPTLDQLNSLSPPTSSSANVMALGESKGSVFIAAPELAVSGAVWPVFLASTSISV